MKPLNTLDTGVANGTLIHAQTLYMMICVYIILHDIRESGKQAVCERHHLSDAAEQGMQDTT